MICHAIRSYSNNALVKNKTVLITGGSKGIGHCIAQKLSGNGYNIILLARDELKLKENVEKLNTFEGELTHRYIRYDLSNMGDGSNLEKLINGYFDKRQNKAIDVLINCAGMTQLTMLPLTPITTIQNIVNVNLVSAMVLSKLVSRKLLNMKRPGQIINISSVLGLDQYSDVRGTSIYSATKLAMVGFTKSVANELQDRHIYCNVVLPSLIRDTEIGQTVNVQEFAKGGEVKHTTKEDVSDAVMQILDKDMNGQVIIV